MLAVAVWSWQAGKNVDGADEYRWHFLGNKTYNAKVLFAFICGMVFKHGLDKVIIGIKRYFARGVSSLSRDESGQSGSKFLSVPLEFIYSTATLKIKVKPE